MNSLDSNKLLCMGGSIAAFTATAASTEFALNRFVKKPQETFKTVCVVSFVTAALSVSAGLHFIAKKELINSSLCFAISGIFCSLFVFFTDIERPTNVVRLQVRDNALPTPIPVINQAPPLPQWIVPEENALDLETQVAYGLDKELNQMRAWLRNTLPTKKHLFITGAPQTGKTSLVKEFQRKLIREEYPELNQWKILHVNMEKFLDPINSSLIINDIKRLSKMFPDQYVLFVDIHSKIWENPIFNEFYASLNSLKIRFIFKTHVYPNWLNKPLWKIGAYFQEIKVPTLDKKDIKSLVLNLKLKDLEEKHKIKIPHEIVDKLIEVATGTSDVIQMLESACDEKRTNQPISELDELDLFSKPIELQKSDIIQYLDEDSDEDSTEVTKSLLSSEPTEIIGLDDVFDNLVTTLASKAPASSVLLVGERNTGKTTLVSKLKYELSQDLHPLLKGRKIIELNCESLTQEKVEEVCSVIKKSPKNYILFIKDFDLLFSFFGLNKYEELETLFKANKTLMIGTTTSEDFKSKSRYCRYFKEIKVPTLDEAHVKKLLYRKRAIFFESPYQLSVTDEAIDQAIVHAKLFPQETPNDPNPHLPPPPPLPHLLDRTIDLLHRACVKALSNDHYRNEVDEKKGDEDTRITIQGDLGNKRRKVLPSHIPPPPKAPPIELMPWIINITAQLRGKAIEERQSPSIIGRDEQISSMFTILAGKGETSNMILIGETGCGKSSLVAELNRRILMDEVPKKFKNKFKDVEIVHVDYNMLMADTRWYGQIEAKFRDLHLLDKNKYIIWFDEIHMLVTDGYKDNGRDLANKFKTLLTSGLRFIGATTDVEYKDRMKRDPAFCRRFEPVGMQPMGKEQVLHTLNVVKKVRFEDKYRLTVTEAAIKRAVDYGVTIASQNKNGNIIDPAIKLLHRVCTLKEPDEDAPILAPRPIVDANDIVT